MLKRRILFLDSSHLVAFRVGSGAVQAEGEFAADPVGLKAFSDYLTRQRGSTFMLLAEVAEEGFQAEDIPHAAGKDREALVKRKLAQYFFGTPLSLALSQGRQKEGRRDERLLLMSLTRYAHFDPWLAALREREAILAGIYSLPQMVIGLLPKDAPKQLLIVTLTRGGLRQTLFVDGRLRFSRLSTLATGSLDEFAVATTIEATKMHQYLVGQRLIERGKQLPVRILIHPGQVSAVRSRCSDTAELQIDYFDLFQEAKRAGLHTVPSDSRAEWLFCHMLARRSPREQFAPAAERQFHRLWLIRFGLKSASAVILAGGLVFAAKQGFGIMQLEETIRTLEQQIQQDRQRYDIALQGLPKIPLTIDNLRALIDRHEKVVKRAPGPEPLLLQLSRSLDAFPDIDIERIDWGIVEQIGKDESVATDMATGPFAQATIDARMALKWVGDQRGQLAQVASFAKLLGAAANTQVIILQQPVDTRSGQTLRSSDEKLTAEAPRFSFRLIVKL